jgi:hypothetical protein
MRYEVSAFGHDYVTEDVGLVLALLAVLASFGALAASLLFPPRERRGAGLGWLSLLPLAFGGVAVAMPALAWLGSADPFFGGGEPRSYDVFRGLLERQLGALVVSAIIGFASAWIAYARHVRESFFLGVILLVAGGLTLASTHEAVELVRVDCLPRIERVGLPYLHVGRERRLEVTLTCGDAAPPPPIAYVADRPGDHAVVFEAKAARYTVSRPVRYVAGEERGSPRFALKEGRTLVYHRHEKERISGKKLDRHDEVTVTILAPRVVDSLRLFPVEVRYGDDEPRAIELFGWNGTLARLEGERLVTFLDDLPLEAKLEGFLLPGVCEGIPSEGPPAPTRCRKAVGTAAGMGASMMSIFTLGSVNYAPKRTVFTLERIEDRVEGGEELAYDELRSR